MSTPSSPLSQSGTSRFDLGYLAIIAALFGGVITALWVKAEGTDKELGELEVKVEQRLGAADQNTQQVLHALELQRAELATQIRKEIDAAQIPTRTIR